MCGGNIIGINIHTDTSSKKKEDLKQVYLFSNHDHIVLLQADDGLKKLHQL